MKISAKLRTGYIYSAAIVIFAGILIYTSFKDMRIKNRELKYVDTISHNVFELNILANEYLIYREKRPKTQWDIVIDVVSRLLGEAAIQASSHQSSLKEIREDIEIVGMHFSDLVSLHPRSKGMNTDELHQQTQNRIQSLMVLKLQRVLHNTAQLKNQIGDELIHIQQFMSWMSITLIMATAFLSIVIGIFVSRSITSPIKHLMRRAESIGSGNFEDPLESTDWKDEIGNLSNSFDKMVKNLNTVMVTRDEAEAANQAKSRFLANMSHELRTPLNAILGTGQIMSRDTDFPEKYKENLEILAHSGEYLLSLVNDVLEISRIEAGRITLTESVFNLKSTLFTIEEMAHLRTKKKGLKLEVDYDPDIPENIRTDKAKLHQILNNLLDNAIKYTKKGGIIIRVHIVNNSGNREIRDNHHQPASRTADKPSIFNLRFIVEDTGIGISQDIQKNIFDHFVQASTAEESIKGVGLGLTICRQYASLMGGRISVRSQSGKGSTFIVELPLESVDESLILPEATKRRVVGLEPDQPMFNILIVEDDDYSRIVLRQMLEQVGFSVQEANDGRQAVEKHKLLQLDLIWMDIRMPVMDGLEATRRIRERELKAQGSKHSEEGSAQISAFSFQPSARAKRVPIIALSASAFEEDKEKVLEAGCDDFVRKPFYEEEIFDKMAQYLEVRYIYGEQEKQDKARIVTRAITPSDLAGLTTDWIDRCMEAAKKGKSAEIFDLLKEIKDDHGRVADAMAEMARNYKYSEIVALIEKGSSYEK